MEDKMKIDPYITDINWESLMEGNKDPMLYQETPRSVVNKFTPVTVEKQTNEPRAWSE